MHMLLQWIDGPEAPRTCSTAAQHAAALPLGVHILACVAVCDTACMQVAKEAHVSGNALGKAVLVELTGAGRDAETVMCVLRAPDHIELGKIAAATGFADARLLSEKEVRVRPSHLKPSSSRRYSLKPSPR